MLTKRVAIYFAILPLPNMTTLYQIYTLNSPQHTLYKCLASAR